MSSMRGSFIRAVRNFLCIPQYPPQTTSWVLYRSKVDTAIDEEYVGMYVCPGCNQSTIIHRQSTSSIQLPHKANLENDLLRFEYTDDLLRFEYTDRAMNKRYCFVPLDCETSIRQIEKLCNTPDLEIDEPLMIDEKGARYELLSETGIGHVVCGCKSIFQLWIQVRRFDEGRNVSWGILVESQEGHSLLEAALSLRCERKTEEQSRSCESL